MLLSTHLSFDGQCEAAFKYYEQILGGKITFVMTYGNSPMAAQSPPGWGDKILHAAFTLDGRVISGADAPAGHFQKPQGISMVLSPKSPEEAERVFSALSEGGTVQMAMQETFWAVRFGMVVDRFGIPWMVNCGKEPQ